MPTGVAVRLLAVLAVFHQRCGQKRQFYDEIELAVISNRE